MPRATILCAIALIALVAACATTAAAAAAAAPDDERGSQMDMGGGLTGLLRRLMMDFVAWLGSLFGLRGPVVSEMDPIQRRERGGRSGTSALPVTATADPREVERVPAGRGARPSEGAVDGTAEGSAPPQPPSEESLEKTPDALDIGEGAATERREFDAGEELEMGGDGGASNDAVGKEPLASAERSAPAPAPARLTATA